VQWAVKQSSSFLSGASIVAVRGAFASGIAYRI
jgi:hypothetical protein